MKTFFLASAAVIALSASAFASPYNNRPTTHFAVGVGGGVTYTNTTATGGIGTQIGANGASQGSTAKANAINGSVASAHAGGGASAGCNCGSLSASGGGGAK